jgi:hypothetical protein
MFFFIDAKKGLGEPIEPADNVSSIFTARRDLLLGVRGVVAGSGLTVEESDLLVALFGVRELGWDDLPHDGEGYVTFNDLELFLVHNPSLLSRRIRKLAAEKPPLVEIADVDPKKSGLHFNCQRVRITSEGVKCIKPIWQRFRQMSAKVLEGIPQRLLDAHYQVNEEISARVRARRSAAMKSFGP